MLGKAEVWDDKKLLLQLTHSAVDGKDLTLCWELDRGGRLDFNHFRYRPSLWVHEKRVENPAFPDDLEVGAVIVLAQFPSNWQPILHAWLPDTPNLQLSFPVAAVHRKVGAICIWWLTVRYSRMIPRKEAGRIWADCWTKARNEFTALVGRFIFPPRLQPSFYFRFIFGHGFRAAAAAGKGAKIIRQS